MFFFCCILQNFIDLLYWIHFDRFFNYPLADKEAETVQKVADISNEIESLYKPQKQELESTKMLIARENLR